LLIYDITVAFGKDSLFAEALDDRFWGVVVVPPAAWVAMPDLDRTALPSRLGSERATSKPTELLQANAAAFQRQAQTAATSREVVGRAS